MVPLHCEFSFYLITKICFMVLGSCWLSVDDGVVWSFIGPMLAIILVGFLSVS